MVGQLRQFPSELHLYDYEGVCVLAHIIDLEKTVLGAPVKAYWQKGTL